MAAYPVGVLSDRLGRDRLLVLGIVFLIIADLVLAFGATIPFLMFGVVIWGLHMGFTQGLLATLVADSAPVELRGTAFGVFNFASGIAMLVASVIAGALWDNWAGGHFRGWRRRYGRSACRSSRCSSSGDDHM